MQGRYKAETQWANNSIRRKEELVAALLGSMEQKVVEWERKLRMNLG